MDKSAELDDPAPGRRNVRRRLVQSTLFPSKTQEIDPGGGDQTIDNDCVVEGDDEDDLECCGSQGKKTRKRKANTTPQNTKPPKKLKEKSPRKTTPKKNGTGNGTMSNNLTEGEGASPPIPNLRLEAKLTAEENSRMFAGRQIHPFFSSWKGGKRNQDTSEGGNNLSSVGRKDKNIIIGPIHVFDRFQDEVVSMDWSNWTFFEKTVSNTSCLEGTLPSTFAGCAVSLTFDRLPCVPHAPDLSQSISSDHYPSSTIPVIIIDDQEDNQLEDVRESDIDEISKVLHERRTSYANSCGNQPQDSLWTDKYQPKKAMEVCGNTEAVKFMSDWLRLWHERGFRAIKDPTGSDNSILQEDSYDCYRLDSDSESTDEGDRLKNVLLVTGPIGSGKSAAIHACAMENGFKVLENNASDCRNGTSVRQKFGEALESHCLNRSLANPIDVQGKNFLGYGKSLCNGEVAQQVNDEEIKVIEMSDTDNSYAIMNLPGKYVSKERIVNDRAYIKPLILFEDVDIFFPEDRGFISAVQQIAEKAKGPVILTSSSKDIFLPHSLNRLDVSFTLPLAKDLLPLLCMICAAEELDVPPYLLEQLIEHCEGDIRKTIMHLQFWFQNKRFGKGKKSLRMCAPLLFDPEAGHQILPNVIPWDFPSQLSELVEKEIAKSLSLMEENLTLMEIAEGKGHKEVFCSQHIDQNENGSMDAKKEAMLSRNCSILANNDFADPIGSAHELSNIPGTPVSFSRRNIHRKHNVVSSDSEDELHHNGFPLVAGKSTNMELFLEDDSRFPSHISNTQNLMNSLPENLPPFETAQLEENNYQFSEMVGVCMNDTCKSVDISCVPDSSFVPETEIDNGTECLSGASFSGYVAETIDVSKGSEFFHNFAPVHTYSIPALIIHEKSDMLGNTCDPIQESPHEQEEDSQNEHVNAVSRGYEVMDECSRIDFKRISKPMEKVESSASIDLVRETWKNLLQRKIDLSQYATSANNDELQIVNLAYRMCNLISEADILLSKCQTLDIFDISTFPCEKADAFSWCKEHLQMTSAVAQSEFSYCTKAISSKGLKLASDSIANLSPDMLTSTTSIIPLGNLIDQDVEASGMVLAGSCLDMSPPKRESLSISEKQSCLLDTIKSIVPSKSYSALKGDAFHEYLSSLCHISRFEASRLSESMQDTKKRRRRGSRHYLSSGALALSHEDISLLTQSNLFGKISCDLKDDDHQ